MLRSLMFGVPDVIKGGTQKPCRGDRLWSPLSSGAARSIAGNQRRSPLQLPAHPTPTKSRFELHSGVPASAGFFKRPPSDQWHSVKPTRATNRHQSHKRNPGFPGPFLLWFLRLLAAIPKLTAIGLEAAARASVDSQPNALGTDS